jgi:ribose-phosphate pyrophosphokinase
MKRASAREICAVIPYYCYARQDRKTQPRDPITAKLIANILMAAGADRLVTLDLHAGRFKAFLTSPWTT